MNLLISTLAALLGSLIGSAARGGVATAQAQLGGAPRKKSDAAAAINVSVSPVAGLVGGAIGSVFGLRVAFWIGSVLGAAGMDRLDARLLAQVGIDLDAMVAKAVNAAGKARESAMGEPADASETAANEPA
jgi:hypothetical protein